MRLKSASRTPAHANLEIARSRRPRPPSRGRWTGVQAQLQVLARDCGHVKNCSQAWHLPVCGRRHAGVCGAGRGSSACSGFDALAARVAADLAANRAAADDALVELSSAEPAQAAAWLQEELSASNDVIERGKRSRQQVELFQPDGDGLRNFAMGHGGCFGRGDRPLGACRGAAGLKLEAPEQQRRFHQVTVTVTG